MTMKNTKFTAGKYYCTENSDYEIEIMGTVVGIAFVQGWKMSTEPIRIDGNGNEFIKLGNQTYSACSRA